MTNRAADLDVCMKDGMDFDALTSLASQVSVRHHKAQARKPLAADLEEALRRRIARAQTSGEQCDSLTDGTTTAAEEETGSCSEIATRFRVSV